MTAQLDEKDLRGDALVSWIRPIMAFQKVMMMQQMMMTRIERTCPENQKSIRKAATSSA
jgi:hypothetical protein